MATLVMAEEGMHLHASMAGGGHHAPMGSDGHVSLGLEEAVK